MALFCDFENVALGVRDANYEKFDIKRVLERLLLKGSIVVKKAYCDWERYKGFKAAMHEANFELIEIPHVRQSGKNSADIRLVVDALDLCYTKSHVNTFVIISGDSDFSPLVSKLRENAKYVIGVGVKQSTSDLLIANCDEFIFYDDLVRESQRQAARRDNREGNAPRRTPEEEQRRRAELDARRTKAVEMAVETFDALVTDRDEGGKIWASVLKEAIKRRNPGFNENYYGFRTFGNLLEEAKSRGLLEFGRDEKSSAYVFRSPQAATAGILSAEPVGPGAEAPDVPMTALPTTADAFEAEVEPDADAMGGASGAAATASAAAGPAAEAGEERRRGRGRRGGAGRNGRPRDGAPAETRAPMHAAPADAAPAPAAPQAEPGSTAAAPRTPEAPARDTQPREARASARPARKTAAKPDAPHLAQPDAQRDAQRDAQSEAPVAAQAGTAAEDAASKVASKVASKSAARRPRKTPARKTEGGATGRRKPKADDTPAG